ncbi:hypothetical protein F5146DRAFT_1199751 [Armillaria mellea]|nr:hypothetical protein F5146DRAFT_1199751 [Armillaria mellea]
MDSIKESDGHGQDIYLLTLIHANTCGGLIRIRFSVPEWTLLKSPVLFFAICTPLTRPLIASAVHGPAAETEADKNGHDVKAVTQGKLPSGRDEEVAPPAPELDSPAKEVSLAALTEPVPEKKVKEAAAVKHEVVILTALVLATVSIRLYGTLQFCSPFSLIDKSQSFLTILLDKSSPSPAH